MDPKEYKYSRQSTWICIDNQGKGKIGITYFAQEQLGDIVYLELPAAGSKIEQFQKSGEIEAQKTIAAIYAPVSGIVLEINQKACDEPNVVNKDPYGEGWLIKIELANPQELDALMTSVEYAKFIG